MDGVAGYGNTTPRPEDPTMDCRQFRKQHAYFIDDMLSGVETWAMRDHVTSCATCSRFDTQLRRSLLIARQAPTLEPSPGFQRKLSARLAAEKLARPAFREMTPPPRTRPVPVMAAAAALLAIGIAGLGINKALDEAGELARREMQGAAGGFLPPGFDMSQFGL